MINFNNTVKRSLQQKKNWNVKIFLNDVSSSTVLRFVTAFSYTINPFTTRLKTENINPLTEILLYMGLGKLVIKPILNMAN